MKKIFTFMLMIIVIVNTNIVSSAQGLIPVNNQITIQQNNIQEIEEHFAFNEKTITQELDNIIIELKNEMILYNNNIIIENWIECINKLKTSYIINENLISSQKSVYYNSINMSNTVVQLIDEAAVGAVLAYFSFMEYDVATILLLHAASLTQDNTTLTYLPNTLISKINASPITQSIRHNVNANYFYDYYYGNNGEYLSGPSNLEMDLHYGINKFNYHWNINGNRKLILDDMYDFEKGDYSGIANIAVNAMWGAQENGVIFPFRIYINI